jgi:hypothetical protein
VLTVVVAVPPPEPPHLLRLARLEAAALLSAALRLHLLYLPSVRAALFSERHRLLLTRRRSVAVRMAKLARRSML